MFEESSGRIPFWVWGILIAVALIIISRLGNVGVQNTTLTERFAPQPTVPGAAQTASATQSDWSQLPAGVQEIVQQMQERLLQGKSAPVLTPVAQGRRLKVEIREVRPTTTGVQVVGQVTNISPTLLNVPVSAFQFRDSAGNVYASSAPGTTKLDVGASTPLDLAVPLVPGRGLSLVVRFNPDPAMEQVLIVVGKP